jgi:hypothetical protein
MGIVLNIVALADRDQTQARDVFDLQILADGGHFKNARATELIMKKTLVKAAENLRQLTYDDFAGHVLEYLDEADRQRYEGEDAWNAMKTAVAEVLAYGD